MPGHMLRWADDSRYCVMPRGPAAGHGGGRLSRTQAHRGRLQGALRRASAAKAFHAYGRRAMAELQRDAVPGMVDARLWSRDGGGERLRQLADRDSYRLRVPGRCLMAARASAVVGKAARCVCAVAAARSGGSCIVLREPSDFSWTAVRLRGVDGVNGEATQFPGQRSAAFSGRLCAQTSTHPGWDAARNPWTPPLAGATQSHARHGAQWRGVDKRETARKNDPFGE